MGLCFQKNNNKFQTNQRIKHANWHCNEIDEEVDEHIQTGNEEVNENLQTGNSSLPRWSKS